MIWKPAGMNFIRIHFDISVIREDSIDLHNSLQNYLWLNGQHWIGKNK